MSALTASDNMTHAPTANSTEAHVSTSLCWSTEPGTDSLTCPVCFREVNTTDLTVFNRHVDQCLSGVPMEHNIHTDTELERGSSVCEEEVAKEREEEKEIAEGERRREEGLMEKGRDPLSRCMLDSLGLRLDSSAGGPRPMTTPKVESHDPREPALTCPVCQVTQDTDNLTLFNLCLNQEVLHELEGLASVDRTTHNATPAAHKEREQPLRRAPQKGKSKRRGSSPPPPSKKAKALGPVRNTIDKFFR
nr:DNA polymerase kappa isoform X2 [Salvelinus alpinus]